MDKERTMRAPKAQSYGAQLLVRALKARSYGTRPSLHDRAGTFASSVINAKYILVFARETLVLVPLYLQTVSILQANSMYTVYI